jgi:hypothetical protein
VGIVPAAAAAMDAQVFPFTSSNCPGVKADVFTPEAAKLFTTNALEKE